MHGSSDLLCTSVDTASGRGLRDGAQAIAQAGVVVGHVEQARLDVGVAQAEQADRVGIVAQDGDGACYGFGGQAGGARVVDRVVDTSVVAGGHDVVAAGGGQGLLHVVRQIQPEPLPILRGLALIDVALENLRGVNALGEVAKRAIADQPDLSARRQLVVGGATADSAVELGGAVGGDQQLLIGQWRAAGQGVEGASAVSGHAV